ncbi:NADAR family protein [Deinococcus budaensis]|uniref:Putative NAD-dependent protein-ADP-ribosyltransferase YbiA (DUF1768 family) n=1 Tax=Deinococcus budaensis TaxID=1665626 RepID=A0A7W8GF16_9DEIO|nr:NADAR family protein [Deinococcus budaensis]MBB5234149.1 putative NAD-dependent protein-ADP-ribosyltransferase YbiA (DUF1768 family) [Deinococcus budaensis]
MRDTLRAEGHHVAGFGFWALRRRVRRQDLLVQVLTQPRDWTWLAFAPTSPHDLPPPDARLLAKVAQGLHGVTLLQWAVDDQALTFTAWPLQVTMVRGQPCLVPGAPRPAQRVLLPSAPLIADTSRWRTVPVGDLLAALVEAYYVEYVAAAEPGAFTNVDVLAQGDRRPVVVEVKRRSRTEATSGAPLTLTVTQTETLRHLRAAGCEVHVTVRVVPPGIASDPARALAEGHWRAGAAVIRPGWGETVLDLLGPVAAPTLGALREARRQALGAAPAKEDFPKASSPSLERTGGKRSGHAVREKSVRPRASSPIRRPKAPGRLTSFTFEFLSVWAPAPVRLRGQTFASVGSAFLAAQTLDDEVRQQLARVTAPGAAVRLARRAPQRPDWLTLRDTVARDVLRFAYREDRAERLIGTLPLLLADPEVFDPLLVGVQGRKGLAALTLLRGQLATRAARMAGDRCFSCVFAVPSIWPGFLGCAHPGGVEATVSCVGKAAVQGPLVRGRGILVPVTTRGGPLFERRSEEPADGT